MSFGVQAIATFFNVFFSYEKKISNSHRTLLFKSDPKPKMYMSKKSYILNNNLLYTNGHTMRIRKNSNGVFEGLTRKNNNSIIDVFIRNNLLYFK